MKTTTLTWLFCMACLLPGMVSLAQARPKAKAKNTVAAAPVQPAPQAQEEVLQPVKSEAGKPVIAIYHFTAASPFYYEHALSSGNAVEAGVVRSDRFTVVERTRFGALKEEDKFKEANTSDIVKKAGRLGAQTLVTGHIVGISEGVVNKTNPFNLPSTTALSSQISLSFKIIDVETGEIKKTEIILGKGNGSSNAEARQKAYLEIDRIVRGYIGEYLPQRFKFASVVEKKTTKKGEYLEKFKIWGGSDNGIRQDDLVEIYAISYAVNPDTQKKVEERKLVAQAKVVEVNSGSSATCSVVNASKNGADLLEVLNSEPQNIFFEYKGNAKKKGGWPF